MLVATGLRITCGRTAQVEGRLGKTLRHHTRVEVLVAESALFSVLTHRKLYVMWHPRHPDMRPPPFRYTCPLDSVEPGSCFTSKRRSGDYRSPAANRLRIGIRWIRSGAGASRGCPFRTCPYLPPGDGFLTISLHKRGKANCSIHAKNPPSGTRRNFDQNALSNLWPGRKAFRTLRPPGRSATLRPRRDFF